ncbi:MAG: hypothetical protein GY761_18060 [Hyphomicrobiales bacterium]|nr:hypothetical protein [Hyphomicrobiales bacterium]
MSKIVFGLICVFLPQAKLIVYVCGEYPVYRREFYSFLHICFDRSANIHLLN